MIKGLKELRLRSKKGKLRGYSSQPNLDIKIENEDEGFFGVCTKKQFDKKFQFFRSEVKSKGSLAKSNHRANTFRRDNTIHSTRLTTQSSTNNNYRKSSSIRGLKRKTTFEERDQNLDFAKKNSRLEKFVARIPNLKKYKISLDALRSKETEEEKLDYIKDKLQSKFKVDLSRFMKLEAKRIARTKRNDKKFKKMQENQKSKDVFNWLQINSEFQGLKKKLRKSLVEIIIDETSFKDVNLDLRRRRQDEESSYNSGVDKIKKLGENYQSTPFLEDCSTKISVNNLVKKKLLKNKYSKKKFSTSNTRAKLDEWTLREEKNYRRNQNKAKRLFCNRVKGAHFIDVANVDNYLGLVNKSKTIIIDGEEKNMNLREFLLKKFMDRKWLTDDELRYLTYSSEFSNQFLDKKFLKKAVQAISVEVVSEVELLIANDIIKGYLDIKQMLLSARNKFLAKKNEVKRMKQLKKIDELEEESAHVLNQVGLEKWLRANIPQARKILRKLERKKKMMEENSEKKKTAFVLNIMQNNKKMPFGKGKPSTTEEQEDFLGRFDREIQKKQMENVKDFIKRNTSKSHFINTFAMGRVNKEKMKHLHHPSSKLFILPAYSEAERVFAKTFSVEPELNEMERMRLHIKGAPDEQRPEKCKNFFSGGPVRAKRPSKIGRKKAAMLIQKMWRGYKGRALVKILKSKGKLGKKKTKGRRYRQMNTRGTSSRVDSSIMAQKNFINPTNEKLYVEKETFKEYSRVKDNFLERLAIEREKLAEAIKKRKRQEELDREPSIDTFTDTSEEDPKFKRRAGRNGLLVKHKPLLAACKDNNFKKIQNSGYQYNKKDVNKRDPETNNTPLYYACKNGSIKLVHYLLARGANPNKVCTGGNTAMHMAFMDKVIRFDAHETSDKMDIMEKDMLMSQGLIINELIQRGGDLNKLNEKMQTPLAYGSAELLQILDLGNGVVSFKGDLALFDTPNRRKSRRRSSVASSRSAMSVFSSKSRRHSRRLPKDAKVPEYLQNKNKNHTVTTKMSPHNPSKSSLFRMQGVINRNMNVKKPTLKDVFDNAKVFEKDPEEMREKPEMMLYEKKRVEAYTSLCKNEKGPLSHFKPKSDTPDIYDNRIKYLMRMNKRDFTDDFLNRQAYDMDSDSF